MEIILKSVSTIPDKPLQKTFENGAVIPNLLQVVDAAMPQTNDTKEMVILK